jgi:hypothetical protein
LDHNQAIRDGRTLRCRLSPTTPTYVDGRVDGLALLGELVHATQTLLADEDAPEAFVRSIEQVTYYGPVHAGDLLEVEATDLGGSDRHRAIAIQVALVASRVPTQTVTMALPAPIPVCTVRATFVIPRFDAATSLAAHSHRSSDRHR